MNHLVVFLWPSVQNTNRVYNDRTQRKAETYSEEAGVKEHVGSLLINGFDDWSLVKIAEVEFCVDL